MNGGKFERERDKRHETYTEGKKERERERGREREREREKDRNVENQRDGGTAISGSCYEKSVLQKIDRSYYCDS